MVRNVRAAQRNHGFSREGEEVLLLIGQWTEIGEILRSPDYHSQIVRSWTIVVSNPAGGPRPSENLADKLNKLQIACDSVVAQLRAAAFNEAEQAMRCSSPSTARGSRKPNAGPSTTG